MSSLVARCLLALCAWLALPAWAQVCAIPGKDGPAATLSGVVNTYYPGTANALAGATTINVGTARGTPALASGDLVLVIQMQDGVNTGNFGTALASYGTAASTAGSTPRTPRTRPSRASSPSSTVSCRRVHGRLRVAASVDAARARS